MPRVHHEEDHYTEESVLLQELTKRSSADSTRSSDFGHLLSEDGISLDSSSDLPPVDGGRRAWSFLLGLWLLEAMLWGFPLAFGIFQRYYSSHELFWESNSIPTIGSLATGISYLGMPFTNPICIRWPQHRRIMCASGVAICVMALVVASFAQHTWQLLLSQGIIYGVGWVVCYTPFLFMFNEWFVEKRGLAFGILNCASGVSGLIIPFAFDWTIDSFGFRHALRAYALVTAVICAPAFIFIRPRVDHSRHQETDPPSKIGSGVGRLLPFCRSIHFALFAVAVFLQGLGFFIPNTFIPSFAGDLGLPNTASFGLLALISVSQVLGQIWQGFISDRINIYIPVAASTLAPGLGALVLWGPSKGLTYLALFSVIWGFFSASYTVLFTRICTFLLKNGEDGEMQERLFMPLYAFFSVERGIANILEGPISSWLLAGQALDVRHFGLGRYSNIVWFTAGTMIVSSAVFIGRFIPKKKI